MAKPQGQAEIIGSSAMEIKANDIFSFIIIHDFPFFCKGAAGIFTQKWIKIHFGTYNIHEVILFVALKEI